MAVYADTEGVVGGASGSTDTVISYERVKENANTIRKCAQALSDIFNETEGIMNTLNSNENLVGRAGDSLLTKFTSFKTKFALYTDAVERFAALIDNAVSQTENTESDIARVAEQLQE